MTVNLNDRLDIAMAAVIRAGTSRPEGWLFDAILAPAPAPGVSTIPPPAKRKAMTREEAERIASDLDGYDGRISQGRLR